jgi:UDP-glucose 4-epimerase
VSAGGDSYFIVGGAGFIGSHFVDRLLAGGASRVTVYDSFVSGRRWHVADHESDDRFAIVAADVHDIDTLTDAMRDHQVVVHLASNPDIARAMTEPTIDFDEGTLLTSNVVEAMRRSGAQRVLYASGSGVYGDLGELEVHEDHGPLVPISTYGASKLAGESLICAYSALFDLSGRTYRFGNVVGPRQTHGVGFDFLRRLREDPTRLAILGDGSQSKSYIHVDDVVDAVLLADERWPHAYGAFNVATGDSITVREIADIAVRVMGMTPGDVHYEFTRGDRGWKGDVPIVRLDTARIQSLGWSCRRGSAEAIEAAMVAMRDEVRLLDARTEADG